MGPHLTPHLTLRLLSVDPQPDPRAPGASPAPSLGVPCSENTGDPTAPPCRLLDRPASSSDAPLRICAARTSLTPHSRSKCGAATSHRAAVPCDAHSLARTSQRSSTRHQPSLRFPALLPCASLSVPLCAALFLPVLPRKLRPLPFSVVSSDEFCKTIDMGMAQELLPSRPSGHYVAVFCRTAVRTASPFKGF